MPGIGIGIGIGIFEMTNPSKRNPRNQAKRKTPGVQVGTYCTGSKGRRVAWLAIEMGNLLSSDLLRQCALAIATLDDRGPLMLCRASATCHQLLAIAEEVARRRCETIGRHRLPGSQGSQPWRRVLGYLCPELRLCKALTGHTQNVQCMVELDDGRHIVSGSDDASVRVWDLETGSCIQHLTGHTGPVNSLVALTDGRIVSGSEDDSLRVWDRVNLTRRCGRIGRFSCAHHLSHTTESHEHDTSVIVLELDDGRIVSGGSIAPTENEIGAMKCFLRIWDVTTGSCTQRLTAFTDSGWYMTVNIVQLADRRIVSGDYHGSVRVWDLATENCTMHLTGHPGSGTSRGPVYSIAVLADSHIAACYYDQSVRVWNLASGSCTQHLTDHTHIVDCLVALTDGRIVSGSRDGSLRVHNPVTGSCAQHLTIGHNNSIDHIVQLDDGRIVSCDSGSYYSGDSSLRVWDLTTGSCRQHLTNGLTGHTSPVAGILQLADGRIVSRSRDATMRVWE